MNFLHDIFQHFFRLYRYFSTETEMKLIFDNIMFCWITKWPNIWSGNVTLSVVISWIRSQINRNIKYPTKLDINWNVPLRKLAVPKRRDVIRNSQKSQKLKTVKTLKEDVAKWADRKVNFQNIRRILCVGKFHSRPGRKKR